MARRKAAVSDSPFIVTPIFAERGKGAALIDVDGNTFLDFAGGIGTLNVGHAHPEIVAAIQSQAERLVHGQGLRGPYQPVGQVAILDEQGRGLGLGEVDPDGGLQPSRLFRWAVAAGT